ncbi:MAG: ribosome-associated translation inhibitor RaiA [Firmicutes bacterium]|nr:ribosome-associated translation inhibitor RaiA [Bacillota bacterium]
MRIEFVSKNFVARDRLKNIVEEKAARLARYFSDDVILKVMLKATGDIHTMELTIIEGGVVMRSEYSSSNMYENIDVALPKLEKQIVKYRKKLSAKSKKFSIRELELSYVPEIHDAEKPHKVVKTKCFELRPMSIDDAIVELELLGHEWYVFLDKATKHTSVLYRRRDGEYGVLETVVLER